LDIIRRRPFIFAKICVDKKGDFVAHYGDKWPYFALVNVGVVNVIKLSPEGRKLGGLKLHSGDEFWSPSLFDGEPLPAALEIVRGGVITIWHRDYILPIIRRNPDILWELLMLLIGRMRQASGFVEGLTFHPVASRLARLLLKQFNNSSSGFIARELSLDEMGAIIGTTPVMVCKHIYRFAEEGLINVSRTEFQLIDQSGLEDVAHLH
jgi:CRP-like cAMP-binding protein